MRRKVEKTPEQIEIENLIDAHGKKHNELAEIHCLIMRADGRMERAVERNLDEELIKEIEAQIARLKNKYVEKLADIKIVKRAIERITGTVEQPFQVPVIEERDVTPVQSRFLLD